jgi:ABC-type multidrug transport system fused ATPase/permease subunit
MVETCQNDLTIGKLIQEYIGDNKGLFVMYVLFILIIPLQDVGLPHFFGKLTKAIQNKDSLKTPLVCIIAIMFILQIGYSIADQVDIKMFPTIQKFVREKMMNHIFEMQKTNYEELKIGEITTKIIKMPALMYSYMEHWKNLFIPQAVVFTVAIIYFMRQDVLIGFTLLILIVSLTYMIWTSISLCEGLARKRDSVYNSLYEEVDDVLRNVITVLNYNQEGGELERIDGYHQEYTMLSQDALKCAMRVRYVFMPIIAVYLIFFTYYMYMKVEAKKLELGSFVAIFIIMIYLTNAMWRIIGNVKDIVLKWGMIKETLDMFKVCDKYKEYESTKIPNLPGIVFYDVSYSFKDEAGNKRELYSHLNLHIKPGERTLIVGQIGSGKTTILKLIMKYIETTGGEIYVNNIPYSVIKPGDLRQFVGYIPQNPILFNRTIYENICYGMPNITKVMVEDAIMELGLFDIFSKMPLGIDTSVGKYGSKISGGQRQIVWIVRTILQSPDIVLMDEPTASIDEKTKEIVNNLLTVLMKGKTIIMVTHDSYLMKLADRVIEMKHGEVVNDKTT